MSCHLKYILIMKKLEFLHAVLRCTAATVFARSIQRSAGDKDRKKENICRATKIFMSQLGQIRPKAVG